jgi:CHAT domain/SIR2-like domain
MNYSELEISLSRRDADIYTVDLRYTASGSEAETRLLQEGDLPLVRFDHDQLRQSALDARKYGQLLANSLFTADNVRSAFKEVRISADSASSVLRLRLFIDHRSSELHGLRWETLCDPDDGEPLFTSDRVLFSRYLSSWDWRPVHTRRQGTLKALVVIANPADLPSYSLSPLKVEAELARARSNLAGIHCSELVSAGMASEDNLLARLREGYDILYLICHSTTREGETYLWLENAEGKVKRVPGNGLVAGIRELRQSPTLIILCACETAGTGDGDAVSAFGPRLAEAGVPAVLAMQGKVAMATLEKFMPAFFGELQRNGHLDGAMAAGRRAVRDQTDWWMPVLFTRLRRGLIWYTPGFGEAHRLEKWPSLINDLKKGRCTPILGHGLTDSLLGSRRELAQKWAERYHFPMAPYNREDLPQVAQYLAVKQNLIFPRDMLISDLHNWLLQQHRANLPQGSQFEGSPTGDGLDQLISAIGAQRRESDPNDPFRVLADIPIPVYITASPHHLLLNALKAAGKQPREEFCRWSRQLEALPSLKEREPNYTPNPQSPLIYYIFGRLNEIESLVLTEDDYFDFLIGATKNKDLIPEDVRSKLANSGLLFLGFQLEDWDFRVLFRRIVDQEGGNLRRRYTNVAVQIDPEEGRIMEPEGARRYLETYFDIADISIYWGTADDFAADLLQQLPKPAP